MKKRFFGLILVVLSVTISQGQYMSNYCPVTHKNYEDNYLSFTQVLPDGVPWKSTWWDYGYPATHGGYHDLSQLGVADFTLGDSISVHIKSTRIDNSRPFYYYLFFDWNNDVDFLDEGERIGSTSASTSKEHIFKLKIPTEPYALGYRVFRIRMSSENLDLWGEDASCVIAGDGETENLSIIIHPNITSVEESQNLFSIKLNGSRLEVNSREKSPCNLILRTLDGKTSKSVNSFVSPYSLNLSDMKEGIYIVEIVNSLGFTDHKKIFIQTK